MLKPNESWTWFYDDHEERLMLSLDDMHFKTNLARKLLVEHAKGVNEFCVEDATAYQAFIEQLEQLDDVNQWRAAELALYAVAAKRFHKPIQPKSWYFDHTDYSGDILHEGDLVRLSNAHSNELFLLVEVGDNASLCICTSLEGFQLDGCKSLKFGEPIKVMHDRMALANHEFQVLPMAKVG